MSYNKDAREEKFALGTKNYSSKRQLKRASLSLRSKESSSLLGKRSQRPTRPWILLKDKLPLHNKSMDSLIGSFIHSKSEDS